MIRVDIWQVQFCCHPEQQVISSNIVFVWYLLGNYLFFTLYFAHSRLGCLFTIFDVSSFLSVGPLDYLGPTAGEDYKQALSRGKLRIVRAKLDLMGKEDAGKTCLGDSLLDEPFMEQRPSTKGATIRVIIRTATGLNSNWKEVRGNEHEDTIDKLLAVGYIKDQLRSLTDEDRKEPEQDLQVDENEKMETSYSGCSSSQEKRAARDVRLSERMSAQDLSNLMSAVEADLNERQVAFINLLQSDKEKLRECEEMIVLTLYDRGGQEQFLMAHAALRTDCNIFSPTAYLLVMDGTKRLDEPVEESSFRRPGGQLIKTKRHGPKTGRDVLRLWVSMVEMAHPPGWEENTVHFLGRGTVLRPPVMFAIATRLDKMSKMDAGLADQQEQIVKEVLTEHKYGDHIVLAERAPNKVLFHVDNTKSGTGTPDSMVIKLKEFLVDMACSYWSEMPETPLPWAVLEKLLIRIALLANDIGKVVSVHDIIQLAKRHCNIPTDRECLTALKYLCSLGVVMYYDRVKGLADKVFTDPQWLFDILSIFVTVLDPNFLPANLWNDLKKLEARGIMSWDLAQYLLQESGVKNEHEFDTILKLLQLFSIICPASDENVEAVLKVGQSFFVPCMLSEEHVGQMKWQQVSRHSQLPPSLVFRPEGFDAIPELLFFRLMSRCVSEWPQLPLLKRDSVTLRLGCDIELELVYHQLHYIIATIYSLDEDTAVSQDELQKRCVYVRQFLVQQLREAKPRGFNFTVCVHPLTGDSYKELIDDDSLVCIDKYDPRNPALVTQKLHGVPLKCLPTLNLWFQAGTIVHYVCR